MSRTDPQVNLRLPNDMRERIRERAKVSRRSMNAEIVHYLDRALADQNEKSPPEAAEHEGVTHDPA
jgi:hypothetical protein